MNVQQIKQRFGIIGSAPLLNRALEIAMQVAPTDISVLVTGESGTGKEIIPQVIHQLSARKHGEYIAVNCGAIPEGTIDSELFGHEKGSFTGAQGSRQGYFERYMNFIRLINQEDGQFREIESINNESLKDLFRSAFSGDPQFKAWYKMYKQDPNKAAKTFGSKHKEFLASLLDENFADGKKKGKSRPGRVKRSGASCNGSVTALRKRAKNASGEKAKMYHWCANMKSGRKKK
jgi:hypothetical protein